jgi:hypothetical protein
MFWLKKKKKGMKSTHRRAFLLCELIHHVFCNQELLEIKEAIISLA